MYGPDASSPKSKTWTMFGWLSDGGRPGLVAEPREEVGVLAELGPQELDRDVALELRVARPVDRRHAALPEELEQPVAPAERLPDLGHGVFAPLQSRPRRGRILPYATAASAPPVRGPASAR